MKTEEIQAIENFIIEIDNTKDNNNKKFDISAKKMIIITLSLFTFFPLVGLVNYKDLPFSILCFCFLLLVCIFYYLQSKWMEKQLTDGAKQAILIFRLGRGVALLLSWSVTFLYCIILITGNSNKMVFPAIIVTIIVIISIPLGVLHVKHVIKTSNGIEHKSVVKAPPFWFAAIIATFFSRLTDDGMIFAITSGLCVINLYMMYATIVPNAMRLLFVKKYNLDDKIPLIFEIKNREK